MVQVVQMMEDGTMEAALIKWVRGGKMVEESVCYEEHPLFSRCVLVHFSDGSTAKVEKTSFHRSYVVLEF